MKSGHIILLMDNLKKMGFEKEVPINTVKRELLKFVGVDKYKIKSALDILIETEYFIQISPGVLKICNGED